MASRSGATVVFIDICGFTSLSCTFTDIVTMLSRYFDQMVKEIVRRAATSISLSFLACVRFPQQLLDRAVDAAAYAAVQVTDTLPTTSLTSRW
jgi:class 3 adenylate cyclase